MTPLDPAVAKVEIAAVEEGGYLMAFKNPEMYRAWNAAHNALYRPAHRAEAVATMKKWRIAHPEKQRRLGRETEHRRRARIRSQFVAPVDAAAIYRRDRGRCHLCGKHVRQADASMDHLKPISLGGVHAPYNVALAHLLCNLKRNNRGAAQLLLALS